MDDCICEYYFSYPYLTSISTDDPFQSDAIQCCNQSKQFSCIKHQYDCSRWFCNDCRIKLNITIDSLWFCSDHDNTHQNAKKIKIIHIFMIFYLKYSYTNFCMFATQPLTLSFHYFVKYY